MCHLYGSQTNVLFLSFVLFLHGVHLTKGQNSKPNEEKKWKIEFFFHATHTCSNRSKVDLNKATLKCIICWFPFIIAFIRNFEIKIWLGLYTKCTKINKIRCAWLTVSNHLIVRVSPSSKIKCMKTKFSPWSMLFFFFFLFLRQLQFVCSLFYLLRNSI